MAESEPAAPAKAGGGGKVRLVAMAAAALLVLLAGGGAAAYFLGLIGGKPAAAVAPAGAEAAHAPEASPQVTRDLAVPKVVFVDLPEILVNLKTSNKRPRYLKLRVAVEVEDERLAEGVKALMPRILDGFQLYLRALDADEIEGAHGMQRLKEELMARLNLSIEPVRISDVLFKEMLVQ